MTQRLTSALGLSLLMLTLVGAVQAKGKAADKPPAGDSEYRAGWVAFVAPALDTKTANPTDARQRARESAIGHFEAAVAANPKQVAYQASLTYVCLSAAKYQKAKAAIDAAIQGERRDPLLYVMRGQAEAALAQMDPVSAGKNIGPAITAFDRAAQLDPKNSLPLLQAASVAFDVDRLDLATPRLKQALERQETWLYRLPVPTDLHAEKGNALRIWEQIQLSAWSGLLARCQNVANSALRLGAQEERLGNLEAAESYFRQAYEVGRKVGRVEPHLFISVGTAIDILDRVYPALARLATARSDTAQAERWEGEAGVLQIGRGELQAAVSEYLAAVKAKPPAGVEAMLRMEAEHVGRVFRGIGLGSSPPAAPKPAEAPGASPSR